MKHNLFLGGLFTLASTFFYSSQVALVKAYANDLPLWVIIFFQCATGLVLFIPVMFNRGLKSAKKIVVTKRLSLHLIRALMSVGIALFLFTSVKYIPLVNAMLLANVAPLMVPFLAYLFLAKKINHHIWMPLLVGFLGVALVLKPNGHIFHPAALLALGASLFAAGGLLAIRRLSETESSETITFYFLLFATLISGVMAIPNWVTVSFNIFLMLVGVGILYALSQYAIAYALRYANAQLVSSLLYMNVVYSAIFAMIFWHTSLTGLMLCGIMLTVLGGILCIRVEYQHRQQRVIQEKMQYAKES